MQNSSSIHQWNTHNISKKKPIIYYGLSPSSTLQIVDLKKIPIIYLNNKCKGYTILFLTNNPIVFITLLNMKCSLSTAFYFCFFFSLISLVFESVVSDSGFFCVSC